MICHDKRVHKTAYVRACVCTSACMCAHICVHMKLYMIVHNFNCSSTCALVHAHVAVLSVKTDVNACLSPYFS